MVCTVGNMASSDYYLSSQQGYKDPSKYYTTGQEPNGVWWNPKGIFGLQDRAEIDTSSFLKLYNGFNPLDGSKLTRNAGLKDRSPGKDLHFAPDKTVSAVWALADNELRGKIEKAHTEAVRVALAETIEKYCSLVRVGTNGANLLDADIMAGMFQHGDSREGDPQLHTHVTLFNFGRALNDKYSPMNGEEKYIYRAHHAGLLYDWKMATGAVYRNALAWKLRTELGFAVEQYGKENDLFRIKGVSEELTSFWSKRRKQIVRQALDEGYTTDMAPARAAGLNKATRKSKVFENDPEARFDRWHSEADQFMNRERFIEGVLAQDASITPEQVNEAIEALSKVPHELTKHEAVFHLKDVIRATANTTSGLVDPSEISRLSERVFASDEVVTLPKPRVGFGRVKSDEQSRVFTTRLQEGEEAEVIAYTERLSQLDRFDIPKEDVRRYIDAKPRPYTKEQLRAIGVATVTSKGIAMIEGAAGAGKSFALRPVADIYREHGFRVYATADAWARAMELSSSCDVEPFAVDKLLRGSAKGKIVVDDKTVIFVDEFSQMSVRKQHRLLSLAVERGAKVIMTGELIQGQAVEAGSGGRLVAEVLDAKTQKALIPTMRRQQADVEDLLVYAEGVDRDTALLRSQMMTAAEKKAIHEQYAKTYKGVPWKITASHHFREKRAHLGLLEYGKRGKVHFMADQDSRVRKLVTDWYNYRKEKAGSSIIIARTNAEVDEISRLARETLLPSVDQRREYDVRVARGDNQKPTLRTLSIAEGDMIKVGTHMEHLDLANGSVVEVVKLTETRDEQGRERLRIDGLAANERAVSFYVDECSDFYGNVRMDYGYARTNTSAQGDTEDRVFVFADEFMARESVYPAMTRHKYELDVYFNRKALAMAVRERLPEDQYDRVITDNDLYEYLGTMMSRDGQKVNALDFYDYVDAEGYDYNKDRDELLDAARIRVEEKAKIREHFPEISYPRQLRIDGAGERPLINEPLVVTASKDLVRFSSSFTKSDAYSWFSRNGVQASDLDAHVHALACYPEVQPLHNEGSRTNPRFTTATVLAEERRLLDAADKLVSRTRETTSPYSNYSLKKISQTYGLSADRLDVVRGVFAGSGLLVYRNTEKAGMQSIMSAVGDYAAAHGERVRSLGVTKSDLDALSALPGRKGMVEGFLYGIGRDTAKADAHDVVIVNGAEKLDNTSMSALLEASVRRGFKLVLVGDEHAPRAFGRNGGFEHLADLYGAVGVSRETATDIGQSALAQGLQNGDHARVVSELAKNQEILFVKDRAAVLTRIDHRLQQVNNKDRAAVIVKSVGERHHINSEIQKLRAGRGELGTGREFYVGVERSGPVEGVQRYFTPDDAQQKYVQTHRIAVHEGDVLVMRAGDREQGIHNGLAGTVTAVSDTNISFVAGEGDERTTYSIDPRKFRAFDLGYARGHVDLQRSKVDHVHGVLSSSWTSHDLMGLWRDGQPQVQLYSSVHVAVDVPTLTERFSLNADKGFVGASLTREEAQRLSTETTIDPDTRYGDLSELEKAYMARLSERRAQAITQASDELGAVFDANVAVRFDNDNRPSAFKAQIDRLMVNVGRIVGKEVAAPNLANEFRAGAQRHIELVRECRAWATDNNASLYDAPRAQVMLDNLSKVNATISAMEVQNQDRSGDLSHLGVSAQEVYAVRQTTRDHLSAARVHKIDVFRHKRSEIREFTQELSRIQSERAELTASSKGKPIWSNPGYAALHVSQSKLTNLGKRVLSNFDDYRAHLPETGITRKAMLESLVSEMTESNRREMKELVRDSNSLDPATALRALERLQEIGERSQNYALLTEIRPQIETSIDRAHQRGEFDKVQDLKVFDRYATNEQRNDGRGYSGEPWTEAARNNFTQDRRSTDVSEARIVAEKDQGRSM